MKDWQRIRQARTDLTDYVIHFTKHRGYFDKRFDDRSSHATSFDVFKEILNEGYIRPTFAVIRGKTVGGNHITVRGPEPAVCLTEQPLSAVLATRATAGSRYSGYGIAYHKYALNFAGGCQVLYGSKDMLGTRINKGEPGYEDGKEIYKDGLPPSLQFLFVQYKPGIDPSDYPLDFTWEREWRVKVRTPGLPVVLEKYAVLFQANIPIGALIVERDSEIEPVRLLMQQKAADGHRWATMLTRIVSLETVTAKLKDGDQRYARIETYPDESTPAANENGPAPGTVPAGAAVN